MKVRDQSGRLIDKMKLAVVSVPLIGDDTIDLEVLSMADVDAMRGRLDLGYREFVVATLEYQGRLEPGDSRIRGLPGSTILRVARTWAKHPSALGASGAVESYEAFYRTAATRVADWDREVREMGERLSALMTPVLPRWEMTPPIERELAKLGSVARTLERAASKLTAQFEAIENSLRSSLPDPEVLARAFREADEGKDILDAHGYGFAVADWGISTLREIARERPAPREVHRAFLELTRSERWTADLLDRVDASPTLRPRSPILAAAASAHQARDYALSVPALYSQLEGTLTDILVLEGRAKWRGHKVIKMSGGELSGLGKKAKHYGKGKAVARAFVTEEILTAVTPDRNAVLHGSKTGYRQASRSARLLLMIDVLTKVVAELERVPKA